MRLRLRKPSVVVVQAESLGLAYRMMGMARQLTAVTGTVQSSTVRQIGSTSIETAVAWYTAWNTVIRLQSNMNGVHM